MSSCSFTYEHYRRTLSRALDEGYAVVRALDLVEGALSGDKVLVLTHDIDLSVQKALRMARVERELGIRSTFFVRVSGLYNVLDVENRRALQQMARWGHEIGLHFPLEFYLKEGRDPREAIRAEKEFLETALGVEVHGFSLHSTGRLRKMCGDELPRMLDALLEVGFDYSRHHLITRYGLRFISDSNRYWRDGCLCLHVGVEPRILALVHPFWWDEEDLPVVTLIERAIRGNMI